MGGPQISGDLLLVAYYGEKMLAVLVIQKRTMDGSSGGYKTL